MSTAYQPYIHAEPYLEVLSGVSFVLSISGGVVKLSGPEGGGKSAICREIGKELKQEKIEFVHFDSAPASLSEFHAGIERKLRLDKGASLMESLTRHIIRKPFDQQKVVLILDAAEALGEDILQELVKLRGIELNEQSLVNVLLCGGEALDKRLQEEAFRTLRESIVVNYRLDAMTREELADFCEAYLDAMGLGEIRLSAEQLEQLHEASGSLPGRVIEELPACVDEETASRLLRKVRQKALVSRATQTLTHEFVDPFKDQELQTEVLSRWKGPLGKSVLVAGALVSLFVAYAAYVFFPDPLIPATVSYFNNLEESIGGDEPQGVLAEAVPPAAEDEEQASAPQEAEIALVEQEVTIEREAFTEALARVTEVEATPQAAVQEARAPTVDAGGEGDDPLTRIRDWEAAWEAQDLDAYFAQYHADFTPERSGDIASWRNQRRRNISRPAEISIELAAIEVLESDNDRASLRFNMEYRSPSYADRTEKEIELARGADGEWKILSERNRSVERLPRPAGSGDRLEVVLDEPAIQPQQDVGSIPAAPAQAGGGLTEEARALFDFVNDWLTAWQRQDPDSYFDYYFEDYRDRNFVSVDAWRAERRMKIRRPSYISLGMDNFDVLYTTDRDALVNFDLIYRSPYYADRTRKELLLARDDNGTLAIRHERNKLVERLPIQRRGLPRLIGFELFR